MRTKEIGRFLKSLDTAERIYLDHCFRISNSIRNIVNETRPQKDVFCAKFKIPLKRYDDFLSGNYDYDLYHTAVLNALWMEIETEKLAKRVPFQVPGLNQKTEDDDSPSST